jgi:alpha-L-arabinofuranosidase
MAHVDISGIQLKNNDTGETRIYRDTGITPDIKSAYIDSIDWMDYTLIFNAIKKDEDSGAEINGIRWFGVDFGRSDEENKSSWNIDWWMNLSSVCCRRNGRAYELMNFVFHPEAERSYVYRLEVNGRRIRTYIDDVLYIDTEDTQPAYEELYYSASFEESTGDVIIKAVNLKDGKLAAELVFDGLESRKRQIEIHELSGYALTDRNSFEEPGKVSSRVIKKEMDGNRLTFEFPEQSLTIFRVKQT